MGRRRNNWNQKVSFLGGGGLNGMRSRRGFAKGSLCYKICKKMSFSSVPQGEKKRDWKEVISGKKKNAL